MAVGIFGEFDEGFEGGSRPRARGTFVHGDKSTQKRHKGEGGRFPFPLDPHPATKRGPRPSALVAPTARWPRFVSAKRGAALKVACCIRHRRRCAAFPFGIPQGKERKDLFVGGGDPVAVPKISALPNGGRLKF